MNRRLLPLLVIVLLFIAAFLMLSPRSTHDTPSATAQPTTTRSAEQALPFNASAMAPLAIGVPITTGKTTQQSVPALRLTPAACYISRLGRPATAQPTAVTHPANFGPATPVAFALAVADLINRQRQQIGIAPLTIIPTLTLAAYYHSIDMATQSIPRHQGSDGSSGGGRMLAVGYHWQNWAEIIGWGFADPSSMVDWWLNHPEHRAILLSPAFTEFGIGYARLTDTPWRTYWTVNFGQPAIRDHSQQQGGAPLPTITTITAPSIPVSAEEEVGGYLLEPPPSVGLAPACPITSPRGYSLIPMEGSDRSHPALYHADLNLAQRGYTPVMGSAQLVDIPGPVDPDAPQLADLFANGDAVPLTSLYQIYDWDWRCGEHGCRGQPLTDPAVTMLGLQAQPGAFLQAPSRQASIYGDRYVATVLYAEPTRITLAYTRDGSVANGYVVHIEQVCVDPTLVQLYQEADRNGRQQLPALEHGRVFGMAIEDEVRVAIRDRGAFLDPRSRKDWWRGD